MDKPKKVLGTGVAVGALAVVALFAVIGLITVYTGAYNIAATEEHTSFGRWVFDTTFHRSVRTRASGIEPPSGLTGMVEQGAKEYKEMCEHCHGGVGVDRDEWAAGMRPRPPHLTEAAAEWQAEEVFWLVKHGAKMTGMPAFGPTHGDAALWSVVAFVKELPAMTPDRYAASGQQPRIGDSSVRAAH